MTFAQPSPASRWIVAATGALLSTGVLLAMHFTREPAWALAPLLAGAAVLLAIRKWPMALCAGLMFVGNFKTTPAQGVSSGDPTLLVLLLCIAAVAVEFLYSLSGGSERSAERLLRGQAALVILFFLFVAVLITSLGYTEAQEYGRSKVARFAVFEVFAFLSPLVLLSSTARLRQLLLTTVGLSVALTGRDLFWLLHPSAQVLQGDRDITQIGDGMMFATALLITIFSAPIRSRVLRFVVCGILVVGLLVATARTPIVALVLALVVMVALTRRSQSPVRLWHNLAGATAVILISAGVLMWMQTLPAASEKVRWKEQEFLAFTVGSGQSAGTMVERVQLDRSALRAASEHPLMGLGAGGWSRFYSKQESPRFPHNFLLEVLAEQGLAGFGLLVAILFLVFRRALRLRQFHAFMFLLPLVTFLVCYNAMTGDLENRQMWFWFGSVAAAERLIREPQLLSRTLAR